MDATVIGEMIRGGHTREADRKIDRNNKKGERCAAMLADARDTLQGQRKSPVSLLAGPKDKTDGCIDRKYEAVTGRNRAGPWRQEITTTSREGDEGGAVTLKRQ